MFGGFQQKGIRPGTEDTALAAGCLEAIRMADAKRDQRIKQMEFLRDRLEKRLLENLEDVIVIGADTNRLPHTSNIAFTGLDRQAVLMAADLSGVAISTGSACASGSSDLSPVLVAMGLEKSVTEGAVRISVSPFNTESEIDTASDRIINIINNLRRIKST